MDYLKFAKMSEEIKDQQQFICDYCGEPCDLKDLRITGSPKVYHMKCCEEACKEIRTKVNLDRKK